MEGVMGGGGDPLCSLGVHAENSECCCAAECGRCGGGSCQTLPGGGNNCCCGAIEKSGRQCDTSEPPCMMTPPPLPPLPPGPVPTVPRPKRGFVADSGSCDDPLLLNVSGWYYAYNLYNPYRRPNLPGNCALANATGHLDARFTPMDWCLDGMKAKVPIYVNRTFFLGFNEPNNLHNCNTEPALVARAWKTIMQQWPDTQLVSPATSGDGIPWFDAFFGNCTALYGKQGCKLSYLAAHDYSCDPNSTMTYIKTLYARYGLRVWLTEFSCGDGAQKRATSDHYRYMSQVIPMLDAAPEVFRYAWMSAHDGSNLRGLVEMDKSSNRSVLTKLGQLYQRL